MTTATKVTVDSGDVEGILSKWFDIIADDPDKVIAFMIVIVISISIYLWYRYKMKYLEVHGRSLRSSGDGSDPKEAEISSGFEHNTQDHEVIMRVAVDINNKMDLLLMEFRKFHNEFKRLRTELKK